MDSIAAVWNFFDEHQNFTALNRGSRVFSMFSMIADNFFVFKLNNTDKNFIEKYNCNYDFYWCLLLKDIG